MLGFVYICSVPDFLFKPLTLECHKYPLHQKEGLNSCWEGQIGEFATNLNQSKQE